MLDMLVTFITFAAFIVAFYQFAKPITYFRLNLGILTQRCFKLTMIFINKIVKFMMQSLGEFITL